MDISQSKSYRIQGTYKKSFQTEIHFRTNGRVNEKRGNKHEGESDRKRREGTTNTIERR